jgi:glycosyltransferase involved in cell wall biosynthesis
MMENPYQTQEPRALQKDEVRTKRRANDIVPMEIDVTIIIPAYNEELSIANQIKAVHDVMQKTEKSYEIIVVDDGSTDDTVKEVMGEKVTLISVQQNRGYGATLKTGIARARSELVVITDADGTYPTDAIPILIKKADDCDMVVGARTGNNVQVPFIRKPAKWFLQKLASYLAGKKIPDLNSGLRVMKKSIVAQFYNILPSGFSFTTTITLALLCNDYLVYYHPIEYYKRIGKSKIRPVDAYYFLLLILRTIVYFNPLKVFLPIGAAFFCGGLAKFIYDLVVGNLSESAVFAFLSAFIIWAIGLLSDQIAKFGLAPKQK